MGPGVPGAAWQPWALLDPDSSRPFPQRINTGKTSQKRKSPTSVYTFVFSPLSAFFTTSCPTVPHSDLPRTLATPGLYSACTSFQIGFVFFTVLIFTVLNKKLFYANKGLPANHLLSRTRCARLNPRSLRMNRHCACYHCLSRARVQDVLGSHKYSSFRGQ